MIFVKHAKIHNYNKTLKMMNLKEIDKKRIKKTIKVLK